MPNPRRRGHHDEGLTRSLRRLDERVRRWPGSRWQSPGGDGRPRAEAAYDLAVTLAELGRLAGNGAPADPPAPVAPHALADQLIVLGRELENAPEAAAYVQSAAAAVDRFLSGL